MIDGAALRAHAAGDRRALERWACRGRAAGAANAVCADKLAVCADVEQQRRLCDSFKRGGGQASDRIRADKPADYGPDQRDGLRMNPQIEIRSGPNLAFESARRVRRAHKLL